MKPFIKKTPESIKNICRASITRNAGLPDGWKHTFYYEDLHADKKKIIESEIRIDDNELPIIACFLSQKSWVLLTTRRILARNQEELKNILASKVIRWDWEGYKGYSKKAITISLTTEEKESHLLEAATGNESRAILYGIRYITGKHE